MKKIVILSLGGSVGKTLITTQLLHSNMPHAKILCVDSVNQTARDFRIKGCQMHSGDEFNKIYRELMSSADDVIVDVGGSKECLEFLNSMKVIAGDDAVTNFIVPSRPSSKDQACAIETLAHLLDGGVEESKISVIFTDVKKSVKDEFQQLLSWMINFDLQPNLNLMIEHSPVFGEMIENKELIINLLEDETDYKAKAANRCEGDHEDYIGKLMRQRMARNQAWPNLQTVYSSLFPEG